MTEEEEDYDARVVPRRSRSQERGGRVWREGGTATIMITGGARGTFTM